MPVVDRPGGFAYGHHPPLGPGGRGGLQNTRAPRGEQGALETQVFGLKKGALGDVCGPDRASPGAGVVPGGWAHGAGGRGARRQKSAYFGWA